MLNAEVGRTWKDPWVIGSMALIVILTVLTYWSVFDAKKQFVNWDDDKYIVGQPLVESLSWDNIKLMFDTRTTVGANYHPLTMLSLAFDAERGTTTMRPFMQTNLALHIVNTLLVFAFVYVLLDRNVFVALVSSLFFAVHPMHVESVAWASARKDVLYTLFFMISLLSYLRYLDVGKFSFLVLTGLAFVLSCLSKPMAVTLPVLLMAIDAYRGRFAEQWRRVLLEKVPLLAVSVYFGLLTVSIQSAQPGGLVDSTTYTILQRSIFAFHAIAQYCYKLFVPINLSTYYPYPSELSPSNVPVLMIIGAAVVLAVLVGILIVWRRSPGRHINLIVFGLFFYLITASLVLQFVSVGGAMIADRYTYVPYIGLFMIIGVGIEYVSSLIRFRHLAVGLTCIAGLTFAMISYQRVHVWTDSETLWTDVIKKFPFEFRTRDGAEVVVRRGVMYAYSNRGIHYIRTNRLDKAITDLEVLYRANVHHPDSFRALGVAYQMAGMHLQAVDALSRAMQQGDVDFQVYRARGVSYLLAGMPERALQDFAIVMQKQPGDALTQGAITEAESLISSRLAAGAPQP